MSILDAMIGPLVAERQAGIAQEVKVALLDQESHDARYKELELEVRSLQGWWEETINTYDREAVDAAYFRYQMAFMRLTEHCKMHNLRHTIREANVQRIFVKEFGYE